MDKCKFKIGRRLCGSTVFGPHEYCQKHLKIVAEDFTRNQVTAILSEHLGVPPDQVRRESKIVDDLDADSLDAVELVMSLEETFGCEIPDDVAESPENLEEMKRVAKINRPVPSNLCFVVMPFKNPVLDTYYAEAVAVTVEDCGLRCVRVDQEHFNGKISDQIQRNIDEAAVVIVDTTGDNANCYFEAGYAVAKKKFIIWQRLCAHPR